MLLTSAALCLAINVFHEARGEPIMGQYAVAQVTIERAATHPKGICGAVLEKKQFSWTNKGVTYKRGVPWLSKGFEPKGKAWVQSLIVAGRVMSGFAPKPVKGASHYHANYVSPDWAKKMKHIATIGSHRFYVES